MPDLVCRYKGIKKMKKIVIFVLLALLLAAVATAGTYRNDSNRVIKAKSSDGQWVMVHPGESIATCYVPTDEGMTETAEAPYYNPLVARHIVTSTGPGDDQAVELDLSAPYLYIYKVTAGITVFYMSTSNTPAVAILRAGDRYQHDLRGRASQILLQFDATGDCEILQTREPVE
jgi:hypothetical protein